MRERTYFAFEAMAALAGAWSVLEIGLRLAVNERSGIGPAGVLALMAAGVLLTAGARRRQLVEANGDRV